tara:strand:- start:514 stop:1158 length:645 start_codon:yes stop_codon:yes gene_type:complete
MITFKEYINEGSLVNKALGAAIALGAISGGAVLGKLMSPHQEPQQQTETQPPVEPTEKKEKSKVDPDKVRHENFMKAIATKHGDEHEVILNAAKRNGIDENDHETMSMLYAIRSTENGRAGKEFGVLHPNAVGKPGQTLDKQAGWASSILMKRKGEWEGMDSTTQAQYNGFPHYLQSKYSPTIGATNDPKGLNNNWLKNFTHHYNENMSFENVQ